MLSRKHLYVGAALVALFVATFAITYRDRQAQDRSLEVTSISQVEPRIAVPLAPSTSSPERRWDVIPSTSAVNAPSSASVVQASVLMGIPDPLPISVNFPRSRNTDAIRGYVVNMSDNPLSIEASVMDPSQKVTSTGRLDLPPKGGQAFGADEGLSMNSGDRVTLRSPPYPDRTVTVP